MNVQTGIEPVKVELVGAIMLVTLTGQRPVTRSTAQ